MSQRSASVEIEPSTSTSEPERYIAESVQLLRDQPTDKTTVSSPLLLPSTSPRTSRFTVSPPSGAHRRQSPRVRRVGGTPRRRETEQPVVPRNDESTTSGSKDTSKSSDGSSSNNNDHTGVEPLTLTAVSGTGTVLVIPEYVEFSAVVVTTAAEVVVEPAAVAVGAGAPPEPHEYCYTTAPPSGLPAAAEVEVVTEESPPLPPSSTSSSRRGPPWPGREHPVGEGSATGRSWPGHEGPRRDEDVDEGGNGGDSSVTTSTSAAGRERPVAEGSTETVARPRCQYCDEPFELASNRRGACRDAHDPAADCVDRASCLCCARAVVYHCLEPADDVSPSADDRDPCACDGGLDGARRCRRWTTLSLLSVIVPCLCFYWPLAGCHRCAVRTGCCGGRHSASSRVVVV